MKIIYCFVIISLSIFSDLFAKDTNKVSESVTLENVADNLFMIEKKLDAEPQIGSEYAKEFITKAYKTEDSTLIALGHYILSRAESYFGNPQLAFFNAKRSLYIAKLDLGKQLKFNVMSNYITVLIELKEYNEALKEANRLLVPMVADNSLFEMQILTTLGTIHSYLEDKQTAIVNWQKALFLADSAGYDSYCAHLGNNIASTYIELDQKDSAYYYLSMAETNAKKLNHFLIDSYIHYTKAEYYFKYGQFESALEEIVYCIDSQRSINDIFISDAYQLKSNILKKLGRFEEAIFALNKHIQIFKEHESQASTIRERKNQLSFELNKTRTEIDILNKQLMFQRRTFYIISGFGVLLSIALTISFIRNRYRTKRIREYSDIMKAQQAELKNVNREMEESREKIIFDANKLMHLNQKLIDSEDELKQLNVTKDKFFSIIAHDLKNPFASMKNLSDMLHDNYSYLDEEDKQELVASMKTTSQRIFELLENLLTWSRSQRGIIQFNPDIVTPVFVVQNNFDLLAENAANKDITLINAIPEDMEIVADSNLLSTVIRNLTSNAIKFTPTGGSITAGAENKEHYTEFYVKDTGVGISEDDIRKLFRIDISHTTIGTGQEKGTGLGLILCKEFVEKHGGQIWVESKVGEGTTFKFTIAKMSLEA